MNRNHIIAFIFFSLFIGFSYSNTLDSSWHLDDAPNILDNLYLHIDDLSLKSLFNALYSNPNNPYELNKRMYRPVACITLALNWYYGKDNVFGYHLVNIAIHLLASFFLYLFLLNLFKAPNLKNNFGEFAISDYQQLFIAFFASLLWAVHPIQTQAVTYIIQRMASLSAMFYILGMLAYVKGRLTSETLNRWAWTLFCGVAFILSVNAKENGYMLSVSLIVIEGFFFSNLFDYKKFKKLIFSIFLSGTMILLIGLWLLP
ncbi:MAG: hypothetical protein WC836_02655, partial [Desulfobacula sp.]